MKDVGTRNHKGEAIGSESHSKLVTELGQELKTQDFDGQGVPVALCCLGGRGSAARLCPGSPALTPPLGWCREPSDPLPHVPKPRC